MTAEKASTIFDRSVGWLLTATGMFLHYQPSKFNSWRRFYLKGVHPWFYMQECLSQQAAVGRLSLPCTNQKYFCSQQVSCAFLHLSDVTEQDMCVCLNDNKCDTDIALSHICLIFFFF